MRSRSGGNPWQRWGPARLGVRARLTLVSSLVLAVALGAAGVLAVVVARSALLQSLDDAAMQRAAEVAGLLEAGSLPEPLPVTGAAVVQVLDAQGSVLASSPGGDRLSPLLDDAGVAAVRAGEAVGMPGSRVGSDEPFRVLGTTAGQGRASTVLVATSVAEVERAAAVLTSAVLLAVPVLVAAIAALTWQVAGSALRPVEQLRLAAAATTPTTARRTLPVPEADDEVARLAVTLNDMLGRLDAASARQRAFVADAAHELRSPLGSLRTQLEVAMARPATQDWLEVARGGVAEVERMSALVDDLLLLARLDEGVARSGPVDVLDVVREAAAGPRRAPVRVEPAGDTPVGDLPLTVVGDRRALFRVAANLLDNAARYAATSVVVTLGTSSASSGPTVVVTVCDDGPGIPAADRERVFERFTRLDPARDRDAGGSGLGLAIVRAVVQRHGGTVVATDRTDGARGAAVVVRLPASPPAAR